MNHRWPHLTQEQLFQESYASLELGKPTGYDPSRYHWKGKWSDGCPLCQDRRSDASICKARKDQKLQRSAKLDNVESYRHTLDQPLQRLFLRLWGWQFDGQEWPLMGWTVSITAASLTAGLFQRLWQILGHLASCRWFITYSLEEKSKIFVYSAQSCCME